MRPIGGGRESRDIMPGMEGNMGFRIPDMGGMIGGMDRGRPGMGMAGIVGIAGGSMPGREGRPGSGGREEGPGELACRPDSEGGLDADLVSPWPGSSTLLAFCCSIVTAPERSSFSCSNRVFLLSATVNLFLSTDISLCTSVSLRSACRAATQFSWAFFSWAATEALRLFS